MEPIRQNMLDTRNLRVLHMSHNGLSDRSIGLLAEGIEVNMGIEEIQFTHNDLSRNNGVKLIDSLRNLPNLKKLCLNSCSLTLECLEALNEAL